MKLSIERSVFVGICLMFFSAIVYAETMYVADTIKLTVRSGPSTENKILAVIESGQQLEMLKPGDEWSYVKLANGKVGYVLTRYLTPYAPSSVKLEQLEAKHKEVTQQAASLLEENSQLKNENKTLNSSVDAQEKELTKLRNDYDKLKAESAEYLQLKSKYEKAAAQLAEQTKRANKLDEELGKTEINQYIKWFLAGSGVLVVGFIIGFSARRQRRRSSLL